MTLSMELQSFVASRFITLIKCNDFPVIEVNFNKFSIYENGELMVFFDVIQVIELNKSTDEQIEYDEKISTFGLFLFEENFPNLFSEILFELFDLYLN